MMTRYPNNPWWSQTRDSPIQISTREQWDEAEARGFLTREHITLRLAAMLRVAFGDPAEDGVAYDEDGFVRAMVAAGWSHDGWRIQLHSNDHDPPHVHFWEKGNRRRQIRLSLLTGEPLKGETVPPGVKSQLTKARRFLIDHQDLLMDHWEAAHS